MIFLVWVICMFTAVRVVSDSLAKQENSVSAEANLLDR
ncbi:MAG: hypothetical protein RLZZ293_641 [Pseudomonadota bacterium]|jgi:hypothetical protein